VSEAEVQRRTEAALESAGLKDMRPAYRRLLVRLKQTDPEAFHEATRRYQEDLEPSIASGRAEPVSAWLDYGAWLAGRLARGQAMAIDASGLARPLQPGAGPESGWLVLHLPEDTRSPAILLAWPADPSEAQRAAMELLVP